MITDGKAGYRGAEGSNVADCFVATNKSWGSFLMTTKVMLFWSQKEQDLWEVEDLNSKIW